MCERERVRDALAVMVCPSFRLGFFGIFIVICSYVAGLFVHKYEARNVRERDGDPVPADVQTFLDKNVPFYS